MQVILTTALHNYKVPVIIKKLKNFTFCLGKSRENFINIFQDFPGLTNKIQGLSRTFQDSKKNPGLSRTFPGCGNPVGCSERQNVPGVRIPEVSCHASGQLRQDVADWSGTRDARRQFWDCPGHSRTVGNPRLGVGILMPLPES